MATKAVDSLRKINVNGCTLRYANIADSDALFQLEQASYPADEMASLESIKMRIQEAGEYFLILQSSENEIMGFINGTCVESKDFGHESMTSHAKDGSHLVIHSVTIQEKYRRRRNGSELVKAYVEVMLSRQSLSSILLLSKANLLEFYRKCGFSVRRLSQIVHGKVFYNLTCRD